jgi:hypothetical protein
MRLDAGFIGSHWQQNTAAFLHAGKLRGIPGATGR